MLDDVLLEPVRPPGWMSRDDDLVGAEETQRILHGLKGIGVADLSERGCRLLHHLAEHHGEVVSRTSLLSQVWGYHFDPGSNVVDVCVRRLRKKLGAGELIETVRHAGYRLGAS